MNANDDDFWQDIEHFVYEIDGEATVRQIERLTEVLAELPWPHPGGSSEDWHRHVVMHALSVWLGSLKQQREGNSAVFAQAINKARGGGIA